MVNSKKRREFNYMDDDDLKSNIISEYGYFNQTQYDFSKRLNIILVEGNYTNAEFANYVELSEPSISNYVTGKRIPRTNELERMAHKLCVPTDYLLGKTDCITFSAQEINKIIGLSENAMKILAMFNHNIEEIQDLMDPMEVSKVHKNKLDIFSLFIEDFLNFSTFLTQIENYVETKQKINNVSNHKEENELLNYDKEKELLEDNLIRH